jgi:putative PIN family toxin of toxin-antitoxin system
VRVVIDTNVFVSFLIDNASVPGRAVNEAVERHKLLLSAETLRELLRVLARPRLQRYIDPRMAADAVGLVARLAEMVRPTSRIDVCRDSDDNRVLELAVDGRADVIVSGDNDLLSLRAYRDVRIVTPRQFLDEVGVR